MAIKPIVYSDINQKNLLEKEMFKPLFPMESLIHTLNMDGLVHGYARKATLSRRQGISVDHFKIQRRNAKEQVISKIN